MPPRGGLDSFEHVQFASTSVPQFSNMFKTSAECGNVIRAT